MRFWTKLALASGVLCLFVSAASAAVVESFRSGGWNGSAYTDDATGRLSTCVAAATYQSGITLYVQVDTSYSWAIGFSAPHWNMDVGSDIPLQYRIDRGAWQQGVAKATSKDLARMQMPQGSYIITRFRRGRTMYVYDGAYNYEFRLTGTSRLMARLAKCVERNVARYGAAPGVGTAAAAPAAPSGGLGQADPAPAQNTAAAADPQLAIEATQALFNLMGSAGISGLKLIPDGQREEDLNGLHAVAADDARTLVAHIFASGSYESEQKLMSLIIADSAENCDGSFSSGTERVTEGGKDVFSSYANCEAGDFQLIERVAIVKRGAGGVHVYGVADTYVGEGGGAPVSPPELTDPDFYAAAAAAAD
ncbi:hypothetical protein E1180_18870 [Roseibium denhamense]|uniref:Uncharacterized protein n=1 Tax=Roseibium denhamense TaxID=76305 RepID=A0ABY1P2M1_9HYPH|nr:hypothetical protein [Roseibium denhamense]MTI07567.1 hypothetical protein [Roseibium denhamense]SMP23889.1 hypothetical protein SAMN06265374_2329 [Roseibium denhamense]